MEEIQEALPEPAAALAREGKRASRGHDGRRPAEMGTCVFRRKVCSKKNENRAKTQFSPASSLLQYSCEVKRQIGGNKSGPGARNKGRSVDRLAKLPREAGATGRGSEEAEGAEWRLAARKGEQIMACVDILN